MENPFLESLRHVLAQYLLSCLDPGSLKVLFPA